MRDLSECRIADLDDIFYATKESQGFNNAVAAIKYVLFDDESVFKNGKPGANKYVYVSNNLNARKKAMLLQNDDLAHILVKYCMQSFGLRGKDFTFTDEEFNEARENVMNLEISPYEMIEYVAYAAIGDIYLAYQFLFENKKLLSDVVSYMIEERYVSNFKESEDQFSGIIDNEKIDSDVRYRFYDAYCNLDDNFAELKKNDADYIK